MILKSDIAGVVVATVVVVGVVAVVGGATMVFESQSSKFNGSILTSAEVSTAQLEIMAPTGTSGRTRYSTSTVKFAPLTSVPRLHVTVRAITLQTPGSVITVYSNGNSSIMVTERASVEP